jgi:hypothetical protein
VGPRRKRSPCCGWRGSKSRICSYWGNREVLRVGTQCCYGTGSTNEGHKVYEKAVVGEAWVEYDEIDSILALFGTAGTRSLWTCESRGPSNPLKTPPRAPRITSYYVKFLSALPPLNASIFERCPFPHSYLRTNTPIRLTSSTSIDLRITRIPLFVHNVTIGSIWSLAPQRSHSGLAPVPLHQTRRSSRRSFPNSKSILSAR